VIEGDTSRKTCGQEGTSEHELIGFQGGIRGTARYGGMSPTRIDSKFREPRLRPPAWMRPAQVQDGFAHLLWKSTQYPSDGVAHLRIQAGASLPLATAAPFAHRPDRTPQRSRNLWFSLSSRSCKLVVCPRLIIEPPIVLLQLDSLIGRVGASEPLSVAATRYDCMRLGERCTRYGIPGLNKRGQNERDVAFSAPTAPKACNAAC
jgi:hypothetical protein